MTSNTAMEAETSDVFDAEGVAALFERAQREVSEGRVPSCQVAIARGDAVQAATFGEATDDNRYVIFSVTKALVAGAVWAAMSDDLLDAGTRVADVIAEFATNGKGDVTVAHLLTHTAGFPRAPMRPEDGATSAGRVERFRSWRLDWPPGTRTAYHASSAHWVLAELLERVTGLDYRRYVTERVLAPLGLSRVRLGVAVEEQDDIVPIEIVGEPHAADEAGLDLETVLAEAAPTRLLRYNEPEVRAIGVPGAGAIGTADEIVRYFQALLRNEQGLWDPHVLAEATGTIRNSLTDPLTNVSVNRSLGLVIAGDDGNAWLREMGRTVGPRTFASSGIGGQIAWADPDTGLSFCFLTNGIAANVIESFTRSSKLSTLAGRCAAA